MLVFLCQFDSVVLYWPYRLTVRTEPSQGSNPGSIPGKVTNTKIDWTAPVFFDVCEDGSMFFQQKKRLSPDAGKFSFDEKKIIVAHAILNAKHTNFSIAFI